ncbi:MAG TPA: hypothetical protein VN963_02290, partial [bacterium]|nr:hypothetical protein [bacterium]
KPKPGPPRGKRLKSAEKENEMKQDPNVTAPPSFPRFILWEIIGIAGFLHILQFAPANDSTPLFFLANAVVFVAAYPVLYFYEQLKIPVLIKFLISPLRHRPQNNSYDFLLCVDHLYFLRQRIPAGKRFLLRDLQG